MMGLDPTLVRVKRLIRTRISCSRRMIERGAMDLDHQEEEEGLGRLGSRSVAAAGSSHIEDQTPLRPPDHHHHTRLLGKAAVAGPGLSLACRHRSEAT